MAGELSLETIDAIAERVVELLKEDGFAGRHPEWVDAAELARRFGVSRDMVYARANDLGVVRMGGRLRFDPGEVAERMRPKPPEPPNPRRQKRRALRPRTDVKLLPIRGAEPG